MNLYLQFGHGMMGLSKELLSAGLARGVILSPRDLTEVQLQRVAEDARLANADCLFDPQCYLHDSSHSRLLSYQYWKHFRDCATSSLFSETGMKQVLTELFDLNGTIGLSRVILPGMLGETITDNWLALLKLTVEEALRISSNQKVIATIALSETAIRSEEQIESVIDATAQFAVDGYYVVAEAPSSSYLVGDPVWLANLLILVAGLKLQGKIVVVGYTSHQHLALAATNVDAIASGSWLNVRAFHRGKFYQSGADDVSRRSVWYYSPSALSEYPLPFLDIARRHGVLDLMAPLDGMPSQYASPLFAGPQPSTIRWGEGLAFRHYLSCLDWQCRQVSAASFANGLTLQESLLSTAESTNAVLRENGVFGRSRDFADYTDVNRSALVALDRALGGRLRRIVW